ncbi:MAG: PLP-dependent aminotransferase family protein [Candidatus Zixiibacteriota bacterium]
MNTNWAPALASHDELLYLSIAKAIAEDVDRGNLKLGVRLPTQRELADRLGVALGTVTRAYAEAERRGLIRSEGRRGTFVGPPMSSRAVLTAISSASPHGIDLSKNHPSYALDPDLSSALKMIARGPRVAELLHYPPAAGLMRHRQAGAAWLNRIGIEATPESVFLTTGAQHALAVIFSAETRPGDIIVSERYTYPGVRALAEQLDLQMVAVPNDDQGILPDALDTVCRQRTVRLLYCNPSLNNPTNIVYPQARRVEIAAVAARHGLIVVEDEINRPLLVDPPSTLADALPEQTFLVISASKALAAGLRVGFVRAPSKAHQRVIDSLNASCLGAPPLMAELFTNWLENGTIDQVISERRAETAARQELAAAMLTGFNHRGHPNSYHVWLELPEGWSGLKLAMEAQVRGVLVTPAEAFAVDRKSPTGAVRLSLVVPPSVDSLKTGLKTVIGLLRGDASHHLATV